MFVVSCGFCGAWSVGQGEGRCSRVDRFILGHNPYILCDAQCVYWQKTGQSFFERVLALPLLVFSLLWNNFLGAGNQTIVFVGVQKTFPGNASGS
ncbi:MAG TPA: hypothetical protein VF797_06495 [Noviherbaspirillum sp.]